MNTCGIESARRHLSELVAAAFLGESTVITKYGWPYAVLTPVGRAEAVHLRPSSLLALKGCARGLLGRAPERPARSLREEWGA